MRREAGTSLLLYISAITLSLLTSGVGHGEQAAPPSGGARVYKEVAPDGTITYTDKPSADSKEVKVPKGTEYTPPKLPAFTPAASSAKTTSRNFQYDSFALVSPKHDEAIWDNTGNITASVSHEPFLQSGHRIEFLLDGTSVAKGSAASHTFTNVDRGTHQLTARIVDSRDEVVETSAITFHLKRHAVGR